MEIGYDPRGDILFVNFGTKEEIKSRRKNGKKLEMGSAYVDLAEDGTILSIEILGASTRYPRPALDELLAYPQEAISLLEASRISGIGTEALKKAAQESRLEAKKIGRNWTTTVGALTKYKENRKHAGPAVARGFVKQATPSGQPGDPVVGTRPMVEQVAEAAQALGVRKRDVGARMVRRKTSAT